MKLKTLKDLHCYGDSDSGYLVSTGDLRQEAIKLIKVINKKIDEVIGLQEKYQDNLLSSVAVKGLDEVLEGQIKVLKDFFNIEEVDLK